MIEHASVNWAFCKLYVIVQYIRNNFEADDEMIETPKTFVMVRHFERKLQDDLISCKSMNTLGHP